MLGPLLQVASAGLGRYPRDAFSGVLVTGFQQLFRLTGLLAAADAALYQGKGAGRNRVILADAGRTLITEVAGRWR